MKFFDWLFKRKTNNEYIEDESFEDVFNEATLDRDDVDINDSYQRQKYIENCLEQIALASKETERLEAEYQNVDAYLKDVEEVEMLSGDDEEQIKSHAKSIKNLSRDASAYAGKKYKLSDSDFKRMQRLESQAEEGIRKIKEAEQYQDAIKQDLRKLEGEKHAYQYRKGEAMAALNNYRGMAVILVCAVFTCIILLLFLQFVLELDTSAGYVLVMIAAAVAFITLFVKYTENRQELYRTANGINKLILLQNKVKIRYINNTNLLDYLYLKYETSSAQAFEKLWQQFGEEKEERMQINRTLADREFHEEQLVRLLKRYRLFDADIWVRQVDAILDPKEMVEVRHNLIVRRQQLRKQMENNKEMAADAQNEIKEIVSEYPAYAKEIMAMVAGYEKQFGS